MTAGSDTPNAEDDGGVAPEGGASGAGGTRQSVDWRQSPVKREQDVIAGAGAVPDEPLDETDLAMAGATIRPDEELPLSADEDVTLPWLEGADDGEEYESYGTGQVLGLVLLGLALLALVVGGIWWATRKGDDGEMVADGSVIEAPEGPYKERPDDPGGMIAEGTGDTSFAVSEGETRPARLGQEGQGPAPKPGFEMVPGSGAGAAAASGSTEAGSEAASTGVGVQVGAYSTRAAAEKGWSTLAGQYSALSGMKHRIVEGHADIGKVYRLQAVAGDAAGAKTLCNGLRASGLNCQVKN